jgi:hypothetical protein
MSQELYFYTFKNPLTNHSQTEISLLPNPTTYPIKDNVKAVFGGPNLLFILVGDVLECLLLGSTVASLLSLKNFNATNLHFQSNTLVSSYSTGTSVRVLFFRKFEPVKALLLQCKQRILGDPKALVLKNLQNKGYSIAHLVHLSKEKNSKIYMIQSYASYHFPKFKKRAEEEWDELGIWKVGTQWVNGGLAVNHDEAIICKEVFVDGRWKFVDCELEDWNFLSSTIKK